ncbi:unnamed protein product [Heligmosomoides polygyrus]|uniref:Secreted protein n=1 Tax=Heligmosomoides polygyrus TaxID=6339 RepID=A0A183FJ33_HELPZ|nr:unnamed protein product [Heligmosomoides polygyrus]
MLLPLYALLLLRSVGGITFVVPESAPTGHVVGYVAGRPTLATQPKYFIVFPDATSEKTVAGGRAAEDEDFTHLGKVTYARFALFFRTS